MFKNKVLLFVVLGFSVAELCASKQSRSEQFEVRELNYQNHGEVQEVASLMATEYVQAMTGLSPEFARAWAEEPCFNDYDRNPKICICKTSIDSQKIYGFLVYGMIEQAGKESIYNHVECLCVAVHEDYQFIAPLMMQYLEQESLKCNLKSLRITVDLNNKLAIKFYHSLGFRVSLLDKILSWMDGCFIVQMYKNIA